MLGCMFSPSQFAVIFITGVTLSTILSFFMGFECIPPLGLPLQPSLTFDEVSMYPTASTCVMQLRLATSETCRLQRI